MTDCHTFVNYIRCKVRYVDKETIADDLSTSSERTKRGILDLGGDILKFLFGRLTESDAQKYTEHIQKLEKDQQTFLRVSQVQRGLGTCQHTLEILVDAFLHAQDGVIQPQLLLRNSET